MPPKLRRPAAVGRAKAAVAPRRVRGGALRRPAGKPEEEGPPEADVLDSAHLTLDQCQNLKDVEVVEGTYWAEAVTAVLRVLEVRIKNGSLTMAVEVLGTQNESLLKAASGLPGRRMEGHLCPATCPGTPHAEGLLHLRKLRMLGAHRESWMSNLMDAGAGAEGEDEMEEVRRDRLQRKRRTEKIGRGQSYSPSPPLRDEVGQKDKKEKKTKKKRKTSEIKIEVEKELGALFRHTGLDPDPVIRRRLKRKAAKLAKRKRGGRSSGSSGSSEETSSSLAGPDQALFGSTNKALKVGRQFPGVLCSAALEEISETLVNQEGGVWNLQGALPPLFCRYYRHQLLSRMSPPMAREAHTLAFGLDLMLRGRPSELMDLMAQRLKSLEMMSNGVHYTVAQQQEMLVKDSTSMASVQEFQEASRLAREEGKARSDASRPYGTRVGGGNRTEEWPRSGGKKGGGKGKSGKGGDQKKGEGEKGGEKKSKGS